MKELFTIRLNAFKNASKKMYFTLLGVMSFGLSFAQINIAPNATVSASTCNTGPCSVLNDQNYGVCGTQLMWISTASPPVSTPGVNYIEWNWPNVESFDEIVIHHAQNNARSLTGGLIQFWDGTSWQNHHTFSNLPQQCINSVTIPRLTTNRMRITSFEMTGSGQTSNPNFREIEIFSAPTAENDAGVSQLVAPVAFCPGTEDIIVRVQNFGVNIIDSVQVNWTLNGTPQPGQMVTTTLDTIGGLGQSFVNITLGSHTFAANTTTNIVAWTSMPNNVPDTINFNDTLSVSITPAISGTYTINSATATGGTNFQSFNDFSNFLDANGICGPVIANVVPNSGPYNERVEFSEVVGASSINTITVNGNGNTLEFTASATAERTTLTMNGADWFTFDSLNVKANGTSFSWVLHLTQGADHNTFKNCVFETSTTSTSTFSSNVVMSGSATSALTLGNNANYNTFENNIHIGGYYSFTLNGTNSTSRNVGNVIKNSVMEDFAWYGIYARAQDSLIIDGNDISRENRDNNSTTYGLFFSTGISNARIMNNRVHDFATGVATSTAASYPIYMSGADAGNAASYNVMANNLVYNMNNGGILYAMYLLGALNNHWRIYHNTLELNEPTSTSSSATRMVFITGAQNNMEIKNNIFFMNRGSSAPTFFNYLTNSGANVDFNNNAYFIPTPGASHNFGFSGGNIATFGAWQTAGFDANGLETDPLFTGGTGSDALKPQSASLTSAGTNVLADVPFDIEGTPRTAAPSPGAFQFEPPQGQDISVTRFLSPVAACPGSADVIVEVGSFASDTVQEIFINWSINNVAQTPVSVTGPFVPGTLTNVTVGSFTIAAGISYDIEVNVDSIAPGPDIDMSNNSLELLGYRAGLSGTFTINQLAGPSGTNFPSFEDFADALNTFGVCGNVIANVVSGTGPYNEQVLLGSISGVSASSTITINGNGNELNFLSTSSGQRYTLGLSGASYVTIDSLRIVALGGGINEFGWGVWMSNGANHNTIKNCEILVDSTQTTTNYGGIIMANDPSNALPFNAGSFGDYNTIENNTIIGGYYGITCIASNISDQSVGNKFIDNLITNYRFYGIYFRGQDSLEVRNNEVTRGDRFLSGFVTYYGIFFSNGFTNAIIDANWIHGSCDNCDNVTSAQYATYFSGASGTAGNANIFSNNIISDINGDGSAYGVFSFTNNFWRFYHNTIVMDDATSSPVTVEGIYHSGITPNTEYVNNVISVDRNGTNVRGINFLTLNNGVGSDYNAIYVPNGVVGRSGTTDYTTLADWQTQGFDLNGQAAPPAFIDPANRDYTPGTPAFSQTGINLQSDVPFDFFGAARGTTPDLGAIEFVPLPCAGAFGLQLDSATASSVFISWSSNETQWVVEWGPVGFLPGSAIGTQVAAPTDSMFEVTGMSSNTCYHIFVAEVCGSDTSDWEGPITVCTPKANDAEMIGLISPEDRECGEDNMDVAVEIRNNGFFPITSADITVEVSGAFSQTFNHTYTGNLMMGQMDVVTVGTADFSGGGVFDVTAYISIPNDEDSANDTISVTDIRVIPEEPRIENLPFCAGDDSVTLFGVYLPNLVGYRWYDAATGGTLLSNDDTITVPASVLPNIWLAYDTAIAPTPMFGTACSPQFTTGCGVGDQIENFSTTGGVTSNVSNLLSGCSPGNYGDFTSQIVDALPGQTINFTVQAGPTWSQGFRIWVDWDNDGAFTGPGEDVWNSVTSGTTPFTGSITVPLSATPGEKRMRVRCDFVNVPTDPCAQQSFGEVEDYTLVVIGGEACSPNRTQADISADSVPVASFTYTELPSLEVQFVNTSTPAGTNATWDFGALGTATGDTVTITYPDKGSFTVCLTVSNFCSSDSICDEIEILGIGVETFAVSNLKLYPNPNEGRFTLTFNQDFISDVSVEIIDLAGKTVHAEMIKNFSGQYNKTFERSDLASGSYLLRIRNSSGTAMRRVTVNK